MVHIPSSQVGIVASKTLIIVLGGLVTYYSYKAYQRTAAPQHKWLTLGFGVITIGAIVGGGLHLIVGSYLQTELLFVSVFVSSSLTAVGLAVVLYSLFVR